MTNPAEQQELKKAASRHQTGRAKSVCALFGSSFADASDPNRNSSSRWHSFSREFRPVSLGRIVAMQFPAEDVKHEGRGCVCRVPEYIWQ
jgi:hypothetical protein